MKYQTRRQACACATLILTSMAHAASPDDVAGPREMPPAMHAMTLRPFAARAMEGTSTRALPARTPSSGGGLDTTPPTLISFSVTLPADVASIFAQGAINIKATDDLSGIAYFQWALTGPHGQSLAWVTPFAGVPARKFSSRFSFDTFADMEPGTWKVTSISVGDIAGNYAVYEGADLSPFGNVEVQAVNSKLKLADSTPPSLVGGKVLTRTVSASATARGTTLLPFVGVDLDVSDAGSGAMVAFSRWCLPDRSSCLFMLAQATQREHASSTLHAEGQIGQGQAPGTYIPYSVDLADFASNDMTLYSKDFGGDTDFSALFPGGDSITVTD